MLVTATPFDCYSTDDASLFDPLLNVVRAANVDVHYTHALPGDLSRFDVILLVEEELCAIDDQKVLQIEGFVNSGGRLIVCANAFFRPSVAKANQVIEKFGLQMEDKEPHRVVNVGTVAEHPMTAGVKKLSFFRPSPIKALDPVKATFLVPSPFDKERAYVCVARDKGEVIVLGQSLWWTWIKDSDNARLLTNFLVRTRSQP